MKWSVLIIISFFLLACNTNTEQNIQGEWIKGTEAQQLETIEKQFRGFDNTMVEVGYRYKELYWAGQDKNWEYANYQLEKIKLTIENGLQRRPKRAKSAEHFLTNVLPQMEKSLKSKDRKIFEENFETMTINCNACHAMEKVPYFSVKTPTVRQSPIH